MNQRQRENSAKYLYDLSKIVFATGVVGNLIAWRHFDVVILLSGLGVTYLFFWAGYQLDRERELG